MTSQISTFYLFLNEPIIKLRSIRIENYESALIKPYSNDIKMKKYVPILLLLLAVFTSYAQEPKAQQVRSVAEVYHDMSWFKEQMKLWREEVTKNPENKEGWLNLYMAALRALPGSRGSGEDLKNHNASNVVEEIKEKFPDSFLYNYVQGAQLGCWNPKALDYLEKAYAKEPENVIAYSDYVVNYEVYDKPEKRKLINKKWFESSKYSIGLLNYHKNVLASLEPNAVIFTGGDNDSYPLWMLQDVKNMRTDITIINTSLAGITDYQNRIFSNLGIKLSASELEEFEKLNGGPDNIPARFLKMITVINEKTNRPIYLPTSFGGDIIKPIEKDLYLVGLVNRYSTEKIDNIALLKKHFLTDYHLDYLEHQNYVEHRQQWMDWINQGYIAGLLTLHKHFKTSNDLQNLEFCKKHIRLLAETSYHKEDLLEEIK